MASSLRFGNTGTSRSLSETVRNTSLLLPLKDFSHFGKKHSKYLEIGKLSQEDFYKRVLKAVCQWITSDKTEELEKELFASEYPDEWTHANALRQALQIYKAEVSQGSGV